MGAAFPACYNLVAVTQNYLNWKSLIAGTRNHLKWSFHFQKLLRYFVLYLVWSLDLNIAFDNLILQTTTSKFFPWYLVSCSLKISFLYPDLINNHFLVHCHVHSIVYFIKCFMPTKIFNDSRINFGVFSH